ncbi:lipase maturation factor 2 [Phascolarctos cinereus]|uniref:Lipase maturation factor n=1 Tax=Phascolarctos cinereus TaxID=38626 RepID=A0A6P5K0N3_PHACI|nr:lipase maturation factor 2 [Phascolarctos cinereus]
MAGSRLPRRLFLQGVAAAFMFAFASLYAQIPGLYGRDGILPARKMLRPLGKGLWQQLWEVPTLLWLSPRLGLDTEQGMELLSLLGTLCSLGALLLPSWRHSLLYLLLWSLYLSLYQVGQVFLYFQWDSLLLETGFLAVLVAPLWPPWGKETGAPPHADVPFWLVRWLLFRLMFASGVVKLTSRCPTWWGLTALTYHYETQCLPTPAAWFAHHLPVWLHKLSVVATFLIEIAVPVLFFAPIRRLRLAAFYSQALLQVLIILTGNYNFFNLLTLVLTTSLLDDQHVAWWLGTGRTKQPPASWAQRLLTGLSLLLEVAVYGLLAYGTAHYFDLELDPEWGSIQAKTAFTFHEFSQWLKVVTMPSVWLGMASLLWVLLTALYRCARIRRWLGKLKATIQLSIIGAATVAMFTISLVPYTYLEPGTNRQLWPGAYRLFGAVERLQLANSYGLFRRMTGLGGRPEVVLEGSYDGQSWTEIEFMYKPGNVSVAPPIVVPHQPRLDWQMWFAALGHHTHSPWFSSLVYRLLQGKAPVIRLLQVEMSKYPFWEQSPTYIRAQLYKYWFSRPGEQGRWWRRKWSEEFFPPVSLGDPKLDSLLTQFGLQDKSPGRPPHSSASLLPRALRWLRDQLTPLAAPVLLWGLICSVGVIHLLQALLLPRPQRPETAGGEKNKPASQKEKGSKERSQAQSSEGPGNSSRAARRKK